MIVCDSAFTNLSQSFNKDRRKSKHSDCALLKLTTKNQEKNKGKKNKHKMPSLLIEQ
jgi:hypothetical protein